MVIIPMNLGNIKEDTLKHNFLTNYIGQTYRTGWGYKSLIIIIIILHQARQLFLGIPPFAMCCNLFVSLTLYTA